MSNLGVAPGYCRCGCGLWVGFWEHNNKRLDRIKGEPKQFAHGHNAKLAGASRPDYTVQDRGFDTPCWVWQKRIMASGHGQLKVDGRSMLAHRHYYEQEKGQIPEGAQIVPLCGVRACVNPEHQEAISKKERNRRSALAKLTKSQVENIRREATNTGYYEKQRIAERYGISCQHVYQILRHHNWAD
jgi:HNH endonuclease